VSYDVNWEKEHAKTHAGMDTLMIYAGICVFGTVSIVFGLTVLHIWGII